MNSVQLLQTPEPTIKSATVTAEPSYLFKWGISANCSTFTYCAGPRIKFASHVSLCNKRKKHNMFFCALE